MRLYLIRIVNVFAGHDGPTLRPQSQSWGPLSDAWGKNEPIVYMDRCSSQCTTLVLPIDREHQTIDV